MTRYINGNDIEWMWKRRWEVCLNNIFMIRQKSQRLWCVLSKGQRGWEGVQVWGPDRAGPGRNGRKDTGRLYPGQPAFMAAPVTLQVIACSPWLKAQRPASYRSTYCSGEAGGSRPKQAGKGRRPTWGFLVLFQLYSFKLFNTRL